MFEPLITQHRAGDAHGTVDAFMALDGEPDGPRSYTAVAWAVKGIAPS